MVLVSHFYRQQAEIGSWPLEFLTPVDFVSSDTFFRRRFLLGWSLEAHIFLAALGNRLVGTVDLVLKQKHSALVQPQVFVFLTQAPTGCNPTSATSPASMRVLPLALQHRPRRS